MDDHDRCVRRVHVFLARREEKVNASGRGQLGVFVERSRVAPEILARTELERVDEDAHHYDIGDSLRFIDEREVTFVKRAHRRHERYATACRSSVSDHVSHFVDSSDRLHSRSCGRHPDKCHFGHRAPMSPAPAGLPRPSRRSA